MLDRTQRKSKRQRVKKQMTFSDRYLAALVDLQDCCQSFDGSINSYQIILKLLASTIEADRAYVWEKNPDSSNCFETIRRAEWNLSEIPEKINYQLFPRWIKLLQNGNIVAEISAELPETERESLASQGIISILILPIIVKGKIFGCVGFENGAIEQKWESELLDFLQVSATTISLVQERQQLEKELQKAKEELQIKWQEQTAELTNALNQLQTEIADRRQAESALEKSISLQRATLEAAVDGIMVVNKNGKIASFNQKFVQMWHIPKNIVTSGNINKTLSFFIKQLKKPDSFVLRINQLNSQPAAESCDTLDFKDGRIFEVYSQPQRIGKVIVGRVWIFRDVTERRMAEETIRYQALHDLLTDLPNRILFNERLSIALTNAGDREGIVAVMFLDLDRFKTINDTLGHTFGDQLLQLVAERLTECLWQHDTIARWGGDEFTVLLPQIYTEEDAGRIAERILATLKQPFHIEGHQLYISSSIGIAFYPHDGEDAQTLLRKADVALYRAKEQGRNNYQFYTAGMNSHASELLVLENELHKALERGEFVVHYQPQIHTASNKISQMEALVRWRHPQLGLIPPAKFVPLAEENGLILQIGEWVLRTACAQNKAWQDAGLPPITVAVNLSARQFQQPNLAEMVARVLEETGLAPNYLELEITESVAMQNVDFSRNILTDLHEMGIFIAMDDFGTGYSSLSYLKKFPLDKVKIDKSFVIEVTEDSNDAAIIAAIAALAKVLNLEMVAEGVETEAQRNFLQSLECDYMQGYLFSPPLSAEDATELLWKFCIDILHCDRSRKVLSFDF